MIFFPSKLEMSSLPDMPDTCAIMEGPIVLAGICEGERELHCDQGSIDEILMTQYEHTYSIFPWKQGNYKTLNQPNNFHFIPLYDVTDEKYTVYFNITNR